MVLAGMQRIRIYTGPDGESHFDGLTPEPLNDIGKLVSGGATVDIVDSPSFKDFHVAAGRELAIILQGIHEYAVKDDVRRFFPGDIVLLEDQTGHGHTFRAIGLERAISMKWPLNPDPDGKSA